MFHLLHLYAGSHNSTLPSLGSSSADNPHITGLQRSSLLKFNPTNLRLAFDEMDQAKDGTLDRGELENGLRPLGLSKSELDMLFQSIDTNLDGTVRLCARPTLLASPSMYKSLGHRLWAVCCRSRSARVPSPPALPLTRCRHTSEAALCCSRELLTCLCAAVGLPVALMQQGRVHPLSNELLALPPAR